MKVCRCSLWIGLLLAINAGCGAAFPSVKVKLNDSAVLPCNNGCSGVVSWFVFSNPTETLVQCDQTSCRSVKEGYQMIHNQYLQGNLSLIITEADFSKRARYTCRCHDKDICDVNLQVEAVNTSVQIISGQSLLLDLDTPEPVEIRYNRTSSASDKVCTVDGRSTRCRHEFANRASVCFELRGMKPTDSGEYDVWDIRNAEVIRAYTVDVQDGGDGSEALGQEHKLRSRRSAESYCPPCVCESSAEAVPGWVVPVLVLMFAALVVAVGLIIWQRRQIQLHQKEPVHLPLNGHQGNGAN